MSKPPQLVFLIDIDNTLLDNDKLKVDIDVKLDSLLGIEQSRRFWELYEAVRKEGEVVDIPETIRRFRAGYDDAERYAQLEALFQNLDFSAYLYPNALETLKYLDRLGTPVILTDGDPVFQLMKAQKSGLSAAVQDRLLIYVHKQQHFDEIMQRYPADRYVMIDDKDTILNATQELLGEKLVAVFVCQGKYARDPKLQADPAPNVTVEKIGDLREFSAEEYYSGKFHMTLDACALPDTQPAVADPSTAG